MNSKDVVVTGVSTGIGWGSTKVLVSEGFRVFGSVRKQADADRLQKEFGNGFVPLMMDVTDAHAVHEAARVASFLRYLLAPPRIDVLTKTAARMVAASRALSPEQIDVPVVDPAQRLQRGEGIGDPVLLRRSSHESETRHHLLASPAKAVQAGSMHGGLSPGAHAARTMCLPSRLQTEPLHLSASYL